MNYGQLLQIVRQLGFKDCIFNAHDLGCGAGFLLQMSYWEADILTGMPMLQQTRMWHLPQDVTEGQVVQTALKCVITSQEHIAREHFTYKGERVFHPHQDIDALLELARRRGC